MPAKVLRVGTRKSALAQVQAKWVAAQLGNFFPEIHIELVLITTSGDRPSNSLAPTRETAVIRGDLGEGGRKALFTKEIEEALLDNKIDLAVHSLKDMAAELPKGLVIAAVPKREDPREAWISKNRTNFFELPSGSKIGTGSIRRQAQLLHFRPDYRIIPVRGNVDTRLKKLQEGNLDGIILALAGIKRLGLEARVTEILPDVIILPAVGQGCLAIEVRADHSTLLTQLKVLDHQPSHDAALAERAFLRVLGGSCQTPIAAYALSTHGVLRIEGRVLSPNGDQVIEDYEAGATDAAQSVGQTLARKLLAAGADKILSQPSH